MLNGALWSSKSRVQTACMLPAWRHRFTHTQDECSRGCQSWLGLWNNCFHRTGKQKQLNRKVSFLKSVFIFSWRIIALQCVGFCQTSTWIRHRCIYVPSLFKLPPDSLPIPPSALLQSPGLSSLSHAANSHVILSIHPTLSFPCTMSKSLFTMS